jgi:hypothetical protein
MMDEQRTDERRMDGAGSDGGASEDPSRAREHVEAAADNRDALAAQSRRTDATTPAETRQPVGGTSGGMSASGAGERVGSTSGDTSGGMSATGGGSSEDASAAAAHAEEAARNRDALAEQHRRVEESEGGR